MPKAIGELISDLAVKAGMKADDESLVNLLSAPDLQKITVPDEFVAIIDRGLLNIDAAKNNHPDIKRKYHADAMDGVDKFLLTQVLDDTFDDNDVAEIKAVKSTQERIKLITAKIKEKSAAQGGKPEDKAQANAKLAELHEQIRLAKEATNTVKAEYEGKIKTIHLDAALSQLFNSYKTIYDDLPGGIKQQSLKAIIQQQLQDKNAELTVNEQGQLTLIGKDGSNVFGSDHVQLTPQSFLDKSFAPILKVSNGSKPNGDQSQQRQQPPFVNGNGNNGNQSANDNFKSIAQQQIQNLETATAQKMM